MHLRGKPRRAELPDRDASLLRRDVDAPAHVDGHGRQDSVALPGPVMSSSAGSISQAKGW